MAVQIGLKSVPCPSYLVTIKDGLRVIREEFCDAKLVAGGKNFKAHKVILVANSKYFYSVFVQNFNEREYEEIRMPPEIDSEAMQTLLDYFYSGDLTLSQNNIESVFRATDYMRLDPLLEICIEFMQETLSPSNCVRRYEMADRMEYFSPRMENFRKVASALIVEEAENVTVISDFLNLSIELITKITNLNSRPEKVESLYSVVLKWVGHDEENRIQFLSDLLQRLPVDGISYDFFNSTIRNEKLIRRDHKTLLWLVDNAIPRQAQASSRPAVDATLNQPKTFFMASRYPCQECFHIKVRKLDLQSLSDRPQISDFSAISYGKKIYLFCGDKAKNSYRLDHPKARWLTSNLDLKFGRLYPGCTVLGDNLFVIGGLNWDRVSGLNSCMKFNFVSGRKENLPAMDERRQLPGVAVHANAVYAACGYEGSQSIERFDPRAGRWSVIGRFSKNLYKCSSTTVADYFYSCDVASFEVERFDFRANRSQHVRSPTAPSGVGMWISSAVGDLFGAVGGSIFKYDAQADEWNKDPHPWPDLSGPIIVPWI